MVGCLHKRHLRARLIAAAIACTPLGASITAAFADNCKPLRPRPIVVLKDMGACKFDPQNLTFLGDPVQQARCLMRGMDATRNLKPMLETLPPALASRIGQESGLPAREALSAYLSKHDLEWDFAAYLWQPLSHARDDDPTAPMARYIVFHDTSGPNFGRRVFPSDINDSPKINNLASFKCMDGWGKAHIVISRSGGILLNHELSIPWRETKFERALNFNGALKGLFIHVEMIQPRRSAGGHGWRGGNDAQSPDPSFTTAEYDRLALVYTVASVRAGHWLIPAFHAAIDARIPNGHDDPLNFDVDSFGASLQGLMEELQAPDAAHVAPEPVASETAAAVAPSAPVTPAAAASSPKATPSAQEAAAVTPPTDSSVSPPSEKTEVKPAAEAAGGTPANAGADNPAPPAAIAKTDEPAGRLAEAAPQSLPEPGQHKLFDHATAGSNEHCQTIIARGHSRRVCGPAVAENHLRPRHARLVRPTPDYAFPNDGRDTWRHRRDQHPRDSWE
jgi:hypothetical protein